ncbi:MAG: hypothetical protein IJ228_13115 [Succinivibrio sp.]|nr:hypothetical protein [Succinivibrio sp.]
MKFKSNAAVVKVLALGLSSLLCAWELNALPDLRPQSDRSPGKMEPAAVTGAEQAEDALPRLDATSSDPAQMNRQPLLKDAAAAPLPLQRSRLQSVTSEPSIEPQYSPRTLIISYDAKQGPQALLEAAQKRGCEIIYRYHIINALALKIAEDDDILKARAFFEQVPGVLTVERDQIMQLHGTDTLKAE